MLLRRTGDGQPCALPQLVELDFGHGRAESLVELSLRGLDVLPLPFQ